MAETPEIHVGKPPEVLAQKGLFRRVQLKILAQGLAIERSIQVAGLVLRTRSEIIPFAELEAVKATEIPGATGYGTLLILLGGFAGTWLAQDFFRSQDASFLLAGLAAVALGFGLDALLQRVRRIQIQVARRTGKPQTFVGTDTTSALKLSAIIATITEQPT